MSDGELENILINKEVIRNRLKIFSVRKNALVFLSIQKEFGSFSNYIWAFVDNKPIKNNPKDFSSIPAKTEISDKISKDLKKRGMSFVGSTIIYAFM
jgi:DNA-3-methyladenine glycosylase I